MSTATETPIHDVVRQAREAEDALAASDAAAVEAARLATATPRSRKELQAAADSARKVLEARRIALAEEYSQGVLNVYELTCQVREAHQALAEVSRQAHAARRSLEQTRRAIEASLDLQNARDAMNERTTPDAQQRLREAHQAVDNFMRDLPPVPAPFSHDFASSAPGVALRAKQDRDSIMADV